MKLFRGPQAGTLLTALAVVTPCFAADLIVEENGVLPNYGTIQSAVTAAQAGDRIFVKNKAGGIPYQESVTIDKPLELLAFTSNGQFTVQGSYTITANPSNFSAQNDSVRIIGMLNQNGSINSTTNNASGNPVRLDLMSNELTSGSITLTGTGLVSRVVGNWVKAGSIVTREANIIGNLVAGDITIFDVATPSDPSVDTLYIVGNRLGTDTGGLSFGSMTWNNTGHYFYIANNWVRSSDTDGHIRINAVAPGNGTNRIINNSVEGDINNTNDGIFLAIPGPAGLVLFIENNVLHNEGGSSTERAIRFVNVSPSSTVVMNYNVAEGWTELSNAPAEVSQTGNTLAPATLNPDNITGVCTTAECVNAGNPSGEYTDHDLTRNDCGVAGGSFNFNNFWPILTGGARVYLVKTPRTVSQGGTISAEAEGHDR